MGLDWSLNLGSLPEKSALGRRRCYPFSNGNDGAYPIAGLTFDASGNAYGTTYSAGAFSGIVFRLKPPGGMEDSWTFGALYGFTGSPDGAQPAASLILDRHGKPYGTTQKGGTGTCSFYGCGTVFEVSP